MRIAARVVAAMLATWCLGATDAAAQTPTCSPTATFTYLAAEEPLAEEAESYSGSAPVLAVFAANPADAEDYTARYEWQIYETADPTHVLVHRFEETLEYTFTTSGSYTVELTATFVAEGDTIFYPEEGEEGTRFSVSIAESKLEMPNAFSPNGDGYNDVYRAKDTYQSIVSFRATIFNRWGQKLYSWNDINGGWDGTVGGRVVRDGVYFVHVEARGADGHAYHIRKDVNVLTRTRENGGTQTGGEE